MVDLIKRLTNLGFVSDVLSSPSEYTSTRDGFVKDKANLNNDAKKVVSQFNQSIEKYGKEYARQSSQRS